LPSQPVPTGRFQLLRADFRGKEFDAMGDGLADNLVERFKDIRLDGAYLPATQALTTAGLAKLVQLPAFADLSYLCLYDCGVDDGMFTHLAKLKRLNNLEAIGLSNVTGKGLGALEACPCLQLVTLLESPLCPEAIRDMQALSALNYLNITGVPCTAEHVAAVTRLKITRLNIARAGINDTLAAELADMGGLEHLRIGGNPVTDKGLAALKKLKALHFLDVRNTRVTEACVADLQQALPACKIQRD
jgi:hypothetical protein